MSSNLVGLIMDVVVLGFLVATIFYVLRLSKSLNDFKTHRNEFNGVITSLLSSIDQAERSIHSLKQVSVQEAGELERLIKQSKAMCEELDIINAAGESMAKRLEKIAEKNRIIAQQNHPHIGNNLEYSSQAIKPKSDYRSTLKEVERDMEANITGSDSSPLPFFMIQDRDFNDNLSASDNIDEQEYDGDIPDNLQSQAEKELFAALNKGRRSSNSQTGKS